MRKAPRRPPTSFPSRRARRRWPQDVDRREVGVTRRRHGLAPWPRLHPSRGTSQRTGACTPVVAARRQNHESAMKRPVPEGTSRRRPTACRCPRWRWRSGDQGCWSLGASIFLRRLLSNEEHRVVFRRALRRRIYYQRNGRKSSLAPVSSRAAQSDEGSTAGRTKRGPKQIPGCARDDRRDARLPGPFTMPTPLSAFNDANQTYRQRPTKTGRH